ncbi:mitochondrial editing factor 9 [Actinidia rufa]|uniref:Mitochondrial editing factor 9 n=1 Tax=Actinidia rufa TaxID=165716 RepID=A0A7J0DG81_9ERIC|nr:mitochondrial editing factor 9 [Actinidia rufa]
MTDRNTVTWNSMITGYVQRREMANARKLFDEMPEKDVVSWNLMIKGYVSCRGSRYVEEGRYLFDRMPKRDFVSWNTMITGYARNGRMEEALYLFNSMPKQNVVSWNAVISGFLHNGDVKSAIEYFERMPERDAASLSALVSGLIQSGELDKAAGILLGNGGRANGKEDLIHAYNTLIAGYAQKGRVDDARSLFDKIPFYPDQKRGDGRRRMPQKNLVSWNSMLSGYEKNGDSEGAIELFIQMQAEGEKPDRHTLSSLLSVCAESVALQLGMQIHQQVIKAVIPDTPLNNSLITMYARCGAIMQARAIFYEMELQKDVISWNAMISGYASHGFAAEALELFGVMKRLKVQPTYITFISVLNACAHAGLAEEGRMHFRSMVSDFGIEARVEHYASLVDIVGRHGQIEEAMALINNMPFEPDKAVWGALLGACRMHNNVELARVAAEALTRLEPESSAPYVLLYNMYADVGRWDDATEVRLIMERNKVRKQTGYSWVESSA